MSAGESTNPNAVDTAMNQAFKIAGGMPMLSLEKQAQLRSHFAELIGYSEGPVAIGIETILPGGGEALPTTDISEGRYIQEADDPDGIARGFAAKQDRERINGNRTMGGE